MEAQDQVRVRDEDQGQTQDQAQPPGQGYSQGQGQQGLTCSMSSQSSRPTKIISLGRRWRVPELLTRNHDVTLIFTGRKEKPRASWKNT